MSGELKVDIISSNTDGEDVKINGNLKVNSITPDENLIVNGNLKVESNMVVNNIEDVGYETTLDLQESRVMVVHGEENKISSISALDTVIPPGTIFPFAGELIPEGWLPCNGSFITIPMSIQEPYFRLYSAIGKKWGANETETEFRIPDLRGRFLRGVDDGQENDPDADDRRKINLKGDLDISENGVIGDTIGSYQNDSFQGFFMGVYMTEQGDLLNSDRLTPDPGQTTQIWGAGFSKPDNMNTDVFAAGFFTDPDYEKPRVSKETRSKNAAVNYIIKI